MRQDWVYLVVTVLKIKNSFRLKKFKPKRLAPNEFCYSFLIEIDEDEWLNRIEEIQLEPIHPPEMTRPEISLMISKETSEIVLDKLAGDDVPPFVEKVVNERSLQ